MIDLLLAMPTILGAVTFMAITTLVGLAVYFLSFRCVAYNRSEDQLKEVKEATSNLFRVVGWLISLFLSLTFADVYRELIAIENASEAEAAAIMDTHDNLSRVEATKARDLLIEYTRAVINDDWPALANDRLSPRTGELLSALKTEIFELPANNLREETIRARILQDMDVVSDLRLLRQQKAQSNPPYILIVVLVGYLVTMAYFGVYRPRSSLLVLVTFYTLLVGIVLYLILAMSAPFQSGFGISPAPFEYVIESVEKDVYAR